MEHEHEHEPSPDLADTRKAPSYRERRAACHAEVEAVCLRHGFRVVARLGPQVPVGLDGSTCQVSAYLDLVPIEAQP